LLERKKIQESSAEAKYSGILAVNSYEHMLITFLGRKGSAETEKISLG
jgi:hypothetical protein